VESVDITDYEMKAAPMLQTLQGYLAIGTITQMRGVKRSLQEANRARKCLQARVVYKSRAYNCQAATSCRRLHLPRATPWTRVGVESGSMFSRHRSPRPFDAPITPRCAPTSDGELHPEQRETELGMAQRTFEPSMNH
jgi:hypothetical protein